MKHLKYVDQLLKKNKELTDDEKQVILMRLCKPKYEQMTYEELSKITTRAKQNILKDRLLTRHYKQFQSKTIDNEDVFSFIIEKDNEKYEELNLALASLDEEEREIIYQKFYDGYTYDELAQQKGETKGQVRYNIMQILKKLKQKI